MGTGKNKKKYSEINMSEILFGDSVTVFDHVEDDRHITLFMKSKAVQGICPVCGVVSDQYHSTYHRNLQAVPIRGKNTRLDVIAYKFYCNNPECSQKVFMESLPFASPSQTRTDELTCIILAVSLFMSNEGASTILKEMGIHVSNDTIGRLYNRLSIEDATDIQAVGIDDVAIRKGQTYATAIYDLADHHMVALLDGREADTLREWLGNHKKIKLVARDRASAYANAINDVLPECTQVADRFHLLQNLIDRMKDIFREELPEKFYIKDGKLLDETPDMEKRLKIPQDSEAFHGIAYDNSPPLDHTGAPVRFDDTTYHPGRTRSKRERKTGKKQQKVIDIRAEWDACPETADMKAFAQTHCVSIPTLKKYLAMSATDVEKLSERHILNRNKNTIIGPYLNMIYKMLRDGFKGDFIYSYILHTGYKGKPSTMIDIIKCIALNNFGIHLQRDFPFYEDIPASVSAITRSSVLKYITVKDDTSMKDSDTAKYIAVIKEAYPIVSQMEEMYQLFHSILMGDEPDELDRFVDKYQGTKGITGFIEGLKRDITPVKNAISLPFSSGFVEGNNNKFKLIKRILYGRSGLANLFRKCYAAFSITQTNVSVQSLIPGLDKRIKKLTEKIMVLTQS